MAAGAIQAIAEAIREGFRLLSQWQESAHVRHLKRAVDAGEYYIRISEREGKFKDMTEKQITTLLRKYRSRFFKYNQG